MTTPGSTAVGAVIYNVFVNGVPNTDFILDAELVQTWGHHDVFVIRIEYNRASAMHAIKPWSDNSPVIIAWGRQPMALNAWYGYVNHHKLSGNADSGSHNLQYTYYCIGSSKPMNTVASKVWGSVTPTYIAKQMAAKHHLRCVVTSTAWILPGEVQGNETDFQFMNRIAAKTGYRFWVSGGTMYFIDPAVVLVSSGQVLVPVYRMDKRLDWQDTMRDFMKLQGDNLPGSLVAQRLLYGVDPVTGQMFQATAGSGANQQVNTIRVATDTGQAKYHVDAWQSLSQFYIAATAELFGNNLLYPGKVVQLVGNAMPVGEAGFWLVGATRHLLKMSGTSAVTNDKFVTRVSLLRNSNASVPYKQAQKITPEFVQCVLSGGIWNSTDISVITDGTLS